MIDTQATTILRTDGNLMWWETWQPEDADDLDVEHKHTLAREIRYAAELIHALDPSPRVTVIHPAAS